MTAEQIEWCTTLLGNCVQCKFQGCCDMCRKDSDMAKNGYLQRQKARDNVLQDAARQTYSQFMVDMITLTLNDPDVMGKDVFGEERLRKVLDALGKKCDHFYEALMRAENADYLRAKIDQALKPICKSGDFVPFEKRYDWLPEIRYDKKP